MPAVLTMNIYMNQSNSQSVFVIPALVWRHFQGNPKFSLGSNVFRDVSQSLPFLFCTSHQRFQLLWMPARMPSSGLILSWNWHFQVYTPHPLRHSWILPETKIHFADESPDVCCRTPRFIMLNKQTTSEQLNAYRRTVANHYNLHPDSLQFIFSIMYKMAAIHSILKWRWL